MIGRRGTLYTCRVLEEDVQNVVTRSSDRDCIFCYWHCMKTGIWPSNWCGGG